MSRHMGKQRTCLFNLHILCQRPCSNALAPILFPQPVANFPFTLHGPAPHTSCHLAVENNDLEHNGLICHDFRQMCHKSFPVARWEGRHSGGIRVELLLVENGQVRFAYIAEEDINSHSISLKSLLPGQAVEIKQAM